MRPPRRIAAVTVRLPCARLHLSFRTLRFGNALRALALPGHVAFSVEGQRGEPRDFIGDLTRGDLLIALLHNPLCLQHSRR